MKKRLLSLVLCLVMVFTLVPFSALAEGETPQATDPNAVAEEKTNLTPGEMTTDSMVTNKWVDEHDGQYDITMTSYATGGTMTQELESDVPLDIVLVLDQSGSMKYDDISAGYTPQNGPWTPDQAIGWYHKVGDNYYEVRAKSGTVYTPTVRPRLSDNLMGVTGESLHMSWNSWQTPYYVMDRSGNLFANNDNVIQNADGTTTERKRVIVVFTDGEPGANGFDEAVANEALNNAAISKETYGASVYTIGLFVDNPGSETGETAVDPRARTFIHQLSSEYYTSLEKVYKEDLDVNSTYYALDENGMVYAASTTAPDNTSLLCGWHLDYDENNQLKVEGFDYSEHYVAEGHPGYQLVVKIENLTTSALGKLYTNDSNSGVFKEGTLVAPLPMPYVVTEATPVSYVMDFNAKMNIADNGKFQLDVTSVDGSKGNGTFYKDAAADATGTISYQLKSGETLADGANLVMSGADTAIIQGEFYEKNEQGQMVASVSAASWKTVTVVPASSVYFDDSFNDAQNPTTLTVGDGSGYNSGVSFIGTQTNAQDESSKEYVIKFTGTGIDIYCTTSDKSSFVQAALFDSSENLIPGTAMTIKNYSNSIRNNVPTLHFEQDDWGTYTVKITAKKTANYQFDGVRVYNPVDPNPTAQKAYEDAREQNATFTSLRSLLVPNDQIDLITEGENGASVSLGGVGFFTDKGDEKTIGYKKNADNQYEPVEYDAKTIAAYTVDGPKNEIYLSNNQGIAFKVTNWTELNSTYATTEKPLKIMVGLSVYGGTANAYINGSNATAYVTPNEMDQYYEVTPDANGVFRILCKDAVGENTLLSVSKLKVSGGTQKVVPTYAKPTAEDYASALSVSEEPESVPMYLAVTDVTVKSMARMNADVDGALEQIPAEPTPEPTPEPTALSVHDFIMNLISSFVRALFNSVARLFGN